MRIADYLNPYAYAMRLRRRLARPATSAGVPVIAIGNLSMGGTGKTPMTMLVVEHLEAGELRVAILLRGYGRHAKGSIVVQDQRPDLVGDEARMYRDRFPHAIVIVCEDRNDGARIAIELGAQAIVLDDAYQHLAIHRDVNILLIDAQEGIAPVLPFGRGREDASAVRDADVIVITNVINGKRAQRVLNTIAKYVRSDAVVAALHSVPKEIELLSTDVRSSPDVLEGMRALAVSSIAKPQRFYNTVAECGAVVMPHALKDHAEYSEHVVARAIDQAERIKADVIVTTTKDIAKARPYYLANRGRVPVVVLHHALEWYEQEKEVFGKIDSVVLQTQKYEQD